MTPGILWADTARSAIERCHGGPQDPVVVVSSCLLRAKVRARGQPGPSFLVVFMWALVSDKSHLFRREPTTRAKA